MQLDLLSHGVDVGPGSLLPVPGFVRICAEAALGCPVSNAPACAAVTFHDRALPAADL